VQNHDGQQRNDGYDGKDEGWKDGNEGQEEYERNEDVAREVKIGIMAIKLGKYSFTGPFASIDKLKERAGIYAIVCKEDREYFLLDVGESSKLRTRVESHDKKACWTKKCNGQLMIYVRYTTFLKQHGRKLIEQELKELFHPDCKIDKEIMKYYISKKIRMDFDQAVQLVTESLKKEGFGVLTEINIQEKLKEKLNVDFRKYKILGACNPAYAYKALQMEDKIGTMLPCSVIIQELGNNEVEVAAVDPIASMMAIENPDLAGIAVEIKEKLELVISVL
jgi:uncharacterized protein (DUF302 family)